MRLQNKSHLLSDRQAKSQCTQLCSVGGKQGASNIKPLMSFSYLTAETELDSSVLLFMLSDNAYSAFIGLANFLDRQC